MNKWELTNEEIEKTWDTFLNEHPNCQWDSTMTGRAIAHEAQKKLFEWLDTEGYLNMQVDAYYKLCKALGRIDGSRE